jgi:fatty acid desaturase
MLSEHERRTLEQIEASIASESMQRRSRRLRLLRTARLTTAILSVGATLWLSVAGIVPPLAGALLIAASAGIAGALLTDATRQWRIGLRRRRRGVRA